MLTGDTEGKVAFSVDYVDRAGNVGTQVTHLTNDGADADTFNDLTTDSDNKLVTFDKTPPYFNETTAQGAGVIKY